MDPLEFLRAHPPFSRLGPETLRRVGDVLEIAYAPRGARLLRHAGPPAAHLSVVRKGSLRLERDGRLLQVLEEGDCFGFPSLMGRASPHADVVAAEDVLLRRARGRSTVVRGARGPRPTRARGRAAAAPRAARLDIASAGELY